MNRPKTECDLLEAVARYLESRAGNEKYQQAWRAAAKHVRDMKKVPDKSEQISSTCARPV